MEICTQNLPAYCTASGSHQSVFLCNLAVIRAEQSNQRTAESTAVFIDLLAGNRTVEQIIFDCLAVVSGNLYNCRILTDIPKGYGMGEPSAQVHLSSVYL